MYAIRSYYATHASKIAKTARTPRQNRHDRRLRAWLETGTKAPRTDATTTTIPAISRLKSTRFWRKILPHFCASPFKGEGIKEFDNYCDFRQKGLGTAIRNNFV